MRISACIGFKDRDPSLLFAGMQSLLQFGINEIMVSNLSDESNAVIMGDFGGDWREVHLPGLPWHEALSKNVAALHSTGNILLFTNCGIIFSKRLVENALSLLEKGKTFVCPAEWYFRCSKETTDRHLCGEDVDLSEGHEWSHEEAGMGDFLLIYKSDFVRIGGYDSRFTGWGALDRDFNARAEECGYKREVTPGTVYHLWDGFPPGQHDTDGGGWKANQEIMKANKERNWWRNELRKVR